MKDFYFDYKNNVLKNKLNITNYTEIRKMEDYFFNMGCKKLQQSKYFALEPDFIKYLHNILFCDLYTWAGQYRLIDIERPELALRGLSLKYEDFKNIEPQLNKVLLDSSSINLNDLSNPEKLDFITNVTIKLWQIHPFRDCNTRTLIAFIFKYCSTNSLDFDISLLKSNLNYFRRSLVAASFSDEELGVKANNSYVLSIMGDALNGN